MIKTREKLQHEWSLSINPSFHGEIKYVSERVRTYEIKYGPEYGAERVRKKTNTGQKQLDNLKLHTGQKGLAQISNMDHEGLGKKSNMDQKVLGNYKLNMKQKGLGNQKLDMNQKGLGNSKLNVEQKGLGNQKSNMDQKVLEKQ